VNGNSLEKVIVTHLFVGENDHLTFQLMAGIDAHSSYCHQFIIVNPGALKKKYIEFFTTRNISGYMFLEHRFSPLRQSRFLLMRRVGIYLLPTLSYYNLFHIARFSYGRLFLHGIDFNIPSLLMLLFLRVRVVFICWGTIATRKVDWLQNALVKWNYALYSMIVCLMLPDKKRFENDFGCVNVFCQPYLNESPEQEACLACDVAGEHDPTVIVGNSSFSFDFYPDVLDQLPFTKLGRVICMLNYGNENRAEEINRFVKHYCDKYGAIFFPWREKVDYETYRKTIATASVYISPVRTQTGLGISYLMLKWGRKVYVRGANFEWLKQCGFIVFDLDSCDLSDADSLLRPLPDDAIKHNRDVWRTLFDLKINSEKWDSIFSFEKINEVTGTSP
jgi:uncharacterized short protein YbdD (DUF466 family)